MTHPDTQRTALVIGATGSFGAHATQALLKHGWTVRALARDPEAARAKAGAQTPVEWIKGDALDAASVIAAAQGVQVIVHAANPPNYHDWKGLVGPMLEGSIAAARATGARIVLPGNVYNFGPEAGPDIGEDAVQAPATRKGALRVQMERRLREVAREGIKSLVLRAGDFFGPATPSSAVAWIVQRKAARLTGVSTFGPPEVGHAFAYMPDLAETLARLLDAEERLADFEVFHFRGHWLDRADMLPQAVREASGLPRLPAKAFPWIVVLAASPFVEMYREFWEMRYLWNVPIGLSNAKLVAFLGEEPHTPLVTALRVTLADMGLAEDRAPQPAAHARFETIGAKAA